jgi:acetolactate synthase-1/2/3 large subunit
MTTRRFLDRQVSVPEAIVRVLEQAGIDHVFGMPGGQTIPIYDALFDHQSTIRTVLTREESLAGVMAEVYGRLTGRPGVCIDQAAFMLANAGLGLLEAHLASSPLLMLTDLSDGAPYSHHGPYQAGTGDYGTWDARQAFGGMTKATMVAIDGAAAVQQTQLAIKHALTGEQGPVAVCYHSAALRQRVGPGSLPRLYPTDRYLPTGRVEADPASVRAAGELLRQAKRPIIIAGNGVRMSRAYDQLRQLAEALDAPVVTTASGKGVFPETHELAVGVFGNFGLEAANAVVAEADLVLAVGTKLGPSDTANENPELLDPERQTFVQIDVEPRNAAWTFPAEVTLVGDAGAVMAQLVATVAGNGHRDGRQRVARALSDIGGFEAEESRSDASPVLPQRLIREIQRALPENGIVTSDAGENRIFMTHYFQTRAVGGYLQPAAVGGMGYAIPAALGAKLVFPDRPVVAVCGDGGFAISMNGLMTAREERIPIVVVVFNNSCLGWVLHGQEGRPIASQFADYDHAAIARAMGCEGIHVERPDEVARALEVALAANRPFVVDVATSRAPTFRQVTSRLVTPAESVGAP